MANEKRHAQHQHFYLTRRLIAGVGIANLGAGAGLLTPCYVDGLPKKSRVLLKLFRIEYQIMGGTRPSISCLRRIANQHHDGPIQLVENCCAASVVLVDNVNAEKWARDPGRPPCTANTVAQLRTKYAPPKCLKDRQIGQGLGSCFGS